MKIMVAGLGLIGGSMAKSLNRAGYAVDGLDRPSVQKRAKELGVIADIAEQTSAYDVVFVALPPDAAMAFMENNAYKEGAIVADICGVKESIERYSLRRVRFAMWGVIRWRGKKYRAWKIRRKRCLTGRV